MNKFKITTEVRAILQDSLGIKTMVGDKIFPLVAPNGTEGILLYINGMDSSRSTPRWELPVRFRPYS